MSSYQDQYTQSHLLAIGIDQYADSPFAPLGNAEADVLALAERLADAPYHFETRLILAEQATRQTVLSALHDLRHADPNSRILVVFAGYGYTEISDSGQEIGYLACAD